MLQMLFRLYPIICLARNSGGADCPCPVLLCFFINHEHYLGEYLPLQGMDLRLEQLDELAENIRIMDQEDGALLKYLSVLEVEQPATLQEALRFSIELDDYERVPDDPEEYGKQVLERIGADEELISTLDGFTDFEAMGNFYMREDGVRRTEFGLLRKLSDPFPEVQDGLQMH